jgi:hypothetical protein
MEQRDPRIVSCLQKASEVAEEIARLEQRATHASIHLALTRESTRLQNAVIFLRERRDMLDNSNVLQLTDKDIEHARREVAYVARVLDEGGKDASLP